MRYALALLALVVIALPNVAVAQEDAPPLHAAIRAGDLAEAERLLEAGADPSELDADGRSPLIDALAYGHESMVYWLLEAGADPNGGEALGRSPMVIAVAKGHPGVVAALLEAGADSNSTDENGRTMLHIAASRESGPHTAVLWELIQAGAEVEARGENGRSPLHVAAAELNVPAVQLLLLAGASMEPDLIAAVAGGYDDFSGSETEEAVQRFRRLQMIRGLLGTAEGMGLTEEEVVSMMVTMWQAAVEAGNAYVLEEYLQPGSVGPGEVPDAAMSGLERALRTAVGLGDEEAVRVLLDAGVPPDGIDASSPPEIVALLEAARAGEPTEPEACSDSACFENAFRVCELGVVFTTEEALGTRVEYEVIGPVEGVDSSGCEVSMVYRENPNSSWVGKPARLILNPQRPFMEEMTQGLQQCVEGMSERYACEGPLLDEMRP